MYRVIYCLYKQPCELLFAGSLQDCLSYIELKHTLLCNNPNKSLRLRKD